MLVRCFACSAFCSFVRLFVCVLVVCVYNDCMACLILLTIRVLMFILVMVIYWFVATLVVRDFPESYFSAFVR